MHRAERLDKFGLATPSRRIGLNGPMFFDSRWFYIAAILAVLCVGVLVFSIVSDPPPR